MATFVLIPGSWLGAWAWKRVTPLLREAGHEVYPVTLTGLGDRAHLGDGETNLSTHVQDVVALIEAEELTDVVLLGHSYSGLVASGVAARIPERLARVFYLGSPLPEDGRSLLDFGPQEFRDYVDALRAQGPQSWRLGFLSDEELTRYYGDHGISAEDLTWVRAHAVGHPLGTYAEPCQLGGAEADALPHTYIRCTEDAPPDLSGPRAAWGYAELPTGHWPMFTMPAELAALLDKAARG
jgi:pimeloyl-ACP methyl ester carboxylesterase